MNPEAPLLFMNPGLDESLLPTPVPWAWIVSATIAIAAIGTMLLVGYLRGRSPGSATNRKRAYEEAIGSLQAAASLGHCEAATLASLAIRRYLCAVWDNPSLFQTHEEFLAFHPSLSSWPQPIVDTLVNTLKELSEIKYRPDQDPVADASTLLRTSRELLQALEQETPAA